MTDQVLAPMSRRSLFRMIGMAAGSAVMYQAMTDLGYAGESGYSGPLKLEGDAKGNSVLVLGAGLAGLTAALELSKAEFPRSRCWNISTRRAAETSPFAAA